MMVLHRLQMIRGFLFPRKQHPNSWGSCCFSLTVPPSAQICMHTYTHAHKHTQITHMRRTHLHMRIHIMTDTPYSVATRERCLPWMVSRPESPLSLVKVWIDAKGMLRYFSRCQVGSVRTSICYLLRRFACSGQPRGRTEATWNVRLSRAVDSKLRQWDFEIIKGTGNVPVCRNSCVLLLRWWTCALIYTVHLFILWLSLIYAFIKFVDWREETSRELPRVPFQDGAVRSLSGVARICNSAEGRSLHYDHLRYTYLIIFIYSICNLFLTSCVGVESSWKIRVLLMLGHNIHNLKSNYPLKPFE